MALSVVINAVILILFFTPIGYRGDIEFVLTIFPRFNAILNNFTFVFLLAALFAMKKKNIKVHRNFIIAAFITTTLFCISYLTYHLALFAFFWGMSMQVEQHRKIVRWTMPVWLYISFAGVLVYTLISPYY